MLYRNKFDFNHVYRWGERTIESQNQTKLLNVKGDGLKISDRADFLSQELAKSHGEREFTSDMIKRL